VEGGLGEILPVLHGGQGQGVELGVHGLGLDGEGEHAARPVALDLRLLEHRRIHLGVLVGLAVNGGLQVGRGLPHLGQRLQVTGGVDALGLGGGAEQAGDVGEAVLLGLGGEGEVLLVGLALAGKGIVEILGGAGHCSP
jgi:hypothetical protein